MISVSYKNTILRFENRLLHSGQKKAAPGPFDGNLAGQHASHYGGTGIPEPVERLASSLLRVDGDDGISGGCNPQHHNPESQASNRES